MSKHHSVIHLYTVNSVSTLQRQRDEVTAHMWQSLGNMVSRERVDVIWHRR